MDFGFRSPSVSLLACVDESGVVRIVSTPRHGSRIEVELPAVPPPRLHGLDAQLVASLMDPEVNRG